MIGIVGGGIAGLAAAHKLQRHGYDAQIFEASEDIGGLAAVHETNGDPIEKYYHHMLKSEKTIIDVVDDLGLSDNLEWRVGKTAFYADGEVSPLDTPLDIVRYPHMSIYDKFRLGMLTLGVELQAGVVPVGAFNDFEHYDDVPAIDFILEHTTRSVYENFFEPLMDAKFGARKQEVSAAWLLGRIEFRNARDPLRGEILGYLDGGFVTLIDKLVDAVGRENITTGTRVTDLAYEDADGSSLTVERGDRRFQHDVEGIIIATMPNVLEDLTGYKCDVRFQGTICSTISMSEQLTDTYWLNLAAETPFGVLIEHTNFLPPERYGGEHLLYAASYVQGPEDDLWQLDDAEVEDRWLSAIDEMFPDFDRESVNWVKTARNPRTAPVYEQGYLDLVIPFDLSETVADGVYYAGMASRAQYPDRSLSGGIDAGFECADRIADAR